MLISQHGDCKGLKAASFFTSGGHGARTRNPLRGTTFPVALRAVPSLSTNARSRTWLRVWGDGQIPRLSASVWHCVPVWLQIGYKHVPPMVAQTLASPRAQPSL